MSAEMNRTAHIHPGGDGLAGQYGSGGLAGSGPGR